MENWENIKMLRSFKEYVTPFVEGVYNNINRSIIQVDNFEMIPSINQMMQNSNFEGSLTPLDSIHYMQSEMNNPYFNSYNPDWENNSYFLWNKIQNNHLGNWTNDTFNQMSNYPTGFNSQVQNEKEILSLEEVIFNLANQIQDQAIAIKNFEVNLEQLVLSLSNKLQDIMPSNIQINIDDNFKEIDYDVELENEENLKECDRKLDEKIEEASLDDQGLEDIDPKLNMSKTIENFIERPPPPFPQSIIEDILISVDFVVPNIKEYGEAPIIQEIPFLVTERALIDMQKGELIMGMQDQDFTFSVSKSMKCSSENYEMCYKVDLLKNYVQKEMNEKLNRNSLKQVLINSKINKSDNEYIIFHDKAHKIFKENYKIN